MCAPQMIKKLQPPQPPATEEEERKIRRTIRRNTINKPNFVRRTTELDGATPNSLPNTESYFAQIPLSSNSTLDSEDDTDNSDDEVLEPAALPSADTDQTVLTPFIDTLFSGSLASYIVCDECKHVGLHIYSNFLQFQSQTSCRRSQKQRNPLSI